MRKRILTILLSVMTVSMCTTLFVSCGRKATVAELPQQKAAASEDIELPALQLAESIAPEVDSGIDVPSDQTAETAAPEIGSNNEVTSYQTAESIAPEVSTDVELTSEQIAEELMSHVWEGSLGDEHYSIVFDSDNYARHTLTDSDGEWQGEGMHSWGLEGNKITLFWEDGELTAEYSKENGNALLVFQDDHGNVGLTLAPTEK
jgi:hypothetical protein